MEEQVNFSVVLEKIIKTDELLQIHLKSVNELQKLQSLYSQLKGENQKLNLRNDTLTFDLEKSRKLIPSLNEEKEQLKKEVSRLEDEMAEVVNNLEIKYQTTNLEVEELRTRLKIYEESTQVQTVPESPKKRGRGRPRKEENCTKMNLEEQKIKDQQENRDLRLEVENLKEQLLDNELKSNALASELDSINNRCQKLVIEKQVMQKNIEMNVTKEKHLVEESKKYLQMINQLQLDIELLKGELDKKNPSDSFKCENCANSQKNLSNVTNNLPMTDLEEIKQSNGEVSVINHNSSSESCEQRFDPELHITETEQLTASNIEELPRAKTPSDKEIERIFDEHIPRLTLSPITRAKTMKIHPSKSQNHSMSGEFHVSTRIPISRQQVIKRNRKFRKKPQRSENKVDLLSALIALKQSNIHFTISNNPILPAIQPSINSRNFPAHQPILTSNINLVKKRKHLFTEVLECDTPACEKCFMSLETDSEGETSLLGFVEVKNEVKTSENGLASQKNQVIIEDAPLECQTNPLTHDSTERDKFKQCGSRKRKAGSKISKPIENETVEEFPNSTSKTLMTHANRNVEVNNAQNLLPNSIQENESSAEGTDSNVDQESIADVQVETDEPKRTGSPAESDNSTNVQTTTKRKIVKVSCFNVKRNPVAHCRQVNSKLTKRRSILKPKLNKRMKIDEDPIVCDKLVFKPASQYSLQSSSIDNELETTATNTLEPKDLNTSSTIVPQLISPIKEGAKCSRSTFKRPVCRTRQSLRLQTNKLQVENNSNFMTDSPASPEPEEQIIQPLDNHCSAVDDVQPVCPSKDTEETEETIDDDVVKLPCPKMAPSKVEVHFEKLVAFPNDEPVLREIVEEFSGQSPEFIADAIIQRISKDYHDAPTSTNRHVPLLTDVQRIFLGFVSKLESSDYPDLNEHILTNLERRILTRVTLEELAPLTRFYLACCKLRHRLHRMRQMCLDVFYFCGNLAVPFLFTVLTSWAEVLPHCCRQEDVSVEPLVKVMVQVVHLKDCNQPGYHLRPLRDLLSKFYGYPTERWDSDELFQELLKKYLQNPVRSADFALLLLCKNQPDKWVHEKIEKSLKAWVDDLPMENFKATLIILIGNLSHRFSSKAQPEYLTGIRDWMRGLLNESTSDVVRRSVYLSLQRLRKK